MTEVCPRVRRPVRHHAVGDPQRVASLKVLNKFLRLNHRVSWLLPVGWGAEPCKEVTESWAVVDEAIRTTRGMGVERDDTSFRVLVVGDGSRPRTASLLLARTGWNITVVDPLMKGPMQPLPEKVAARLKVVCGKVEDVQEKFPLVLAIHSHAPVDATMARVAKGGMAVSLPCCVPWDDGHRILVDGCLSPDRVLVVRRGAP